MLFLGITDFITAQNLSDIINKMTQDHSENGNHYANKFTIDFIEEKYKDDIFRYTKAILY